MGTFRVSIQLAGTTMEALVDTGASYTVIPRDVLERLGTQPDEERLFVLADGREVRYPMAWARVAIGERIQPTLVVFGEPGTEPILGAFTLEGFGLGVDPVNRRLIVVPGLLKRVAGALKMLQHAKAAPLDHPPWSSAQSLTSGRSVSTSCRSASAWPMS